MSSAINIRKVPSTSKTGARLPSAAAAGSVLLMGAAALLFANDALACRDDDVAHSGHAKQLAVSKTAMSSHAAIGQKSNGSGVSVDAKTAKTIAIGEASPLTLSFAAASHEGAKAQVRAPQGATVTRADGSPVGDIALTVGKPTTVDLLVTATGDGLQYLDVTTHQNARSSVRSVALRVGSGEAKLKTAGRVEIDSRGQRMKIMQAETR